MAEFLAPAGEVVDVYIPSDRATGKPRGFAFVEFASDNEAEQAIQQFDGGELGGRNLRINAAESRPPRPGGFSAPPAPPRGGKGGAGGFGGGGKSKGSRRGLRGKKRSL